MKTMLYLTISPNSSKLWLLLILLAISFTAHAQQNQTATESDTLNESWIQSHAWRIAELEKEKKMDSIIKAKIESEMASLTAADDNQKAELEQKLKELEEMERNRLAEKQKRIDLLKQNAIGFPVNGVFADTLFQVYARVASVQPAERAASISRRIRTLSENDFLKTDSIVILNSEYTADIIYGDMIIMSITETDAMLQGKTKMGLATEYAGIIRNDLRMAKEETRLSKQLVRAGLVLLVIVVTYLLFLLITRGFRYIQGYFDKKRELWLRNLNYKDYTFLTAEQEYKVILLLMKISKWFVYALLGYTALPIIFSIFPFTRGWAEQLFHLFWMPFKGVLTAVWEYFPNLFSILVIYFVMKYFIRLVKYIFNEISSEKLVISGFHADWALPTYTIVRFLLYAFMLVLIFPYLPGSDSNIFRGVSVFVGILFSLGSSTAIANMVAGLVITYMRPFKTGDFIKISDNKGIVIEKTLLVTRIKTIHNEIITIPNSSVLTGNTVNYSSESGARGLIVNTTVTIGYDAPWKDVEDALTEAANRCDFIEKEPKPYVFQTSLDDFYVSYQLNAFTRQADRQAHVYTQLHRNIQDVFNERGIEIMSPHYRAARDGNTTTIPSVYLPHDYQPPKFGVKMD